MLTLREFREKLRREGLNFGEHAQSYIHARNMQHCDMLKVKNASVKFTHYVTHCNICCLLVSNPVNVYKGTHTTVVTVTGENIVRWSRWRVVEDSIVLSFAPS